MTRPLTQARRPGGRGLVARSCLAAVLSAVPGAAAAQEVVGFVLEVRGEWVSGERAPRVVWQGMKLYSGERVRPKQVAPLTPLDRPPKLVACLDTGKTKTYTGPAKLPDHQPPSLVNRVWFALVGRPAGDFAHALTKGLGDFDTVIKRDGSAVDLTPLLRGRGPGEYIARFEPVAPAPAGAAGVRVRYRWPSADPQPVGADGLRDGLYTWTLALPDGGDGGTGWVLVCPAREFERVKQSFGEAVALTAAWEPGPSPSAVVGFQRAYLKSLAERLGR